MEYYSAIGSTDYTIYLNKVRSLIKRQESGQVPRPGAEGPSAQKASTASESKKAQS